MFSKPFISKEEIDEFYGDWKMHDECGRQTIILYHYSKALF